MQPAPVIKILVVDDREDNLFSIETILERDDYTIIKAGSGRAALKILLQQQDFSLILMDVQMPGMNGLETAALIYERDKLKDIPIIFITANSRDEEFMFRGYKTGGVDYIYKPVNPELLKLKVSVFIELFRKNQQLATHERQLLATNAHLQKEIEERRLSEEKVKTLNEQLLKNNGYLKAVDEELDRFAFVASHDLQEPLRKIMIFGDMLARADIMNAEEGRYVKKILDSSKRMQQFINDLLQFSRHNISDKDFTVMPLTQIVKEVVGDFEINIQETHAQITAEELPVVEVIPGLVRQLFYNIIANALKFRKKNLAPSIHIYAEPPNLLPQNKKHYHTIHIADNGIGFDEKYAEEIFGVFKRLHAYHEFEGTGIGLSICKKIVEKHNGFITAKGKIGEGAVFTIQLPQKQ